MKKWVLLFAIIGFLGAAAFYSPYIGINGQNALECPICACVTTLWGTPTHRYILFIITFGIPNALLFAGFAALAISLWRALKRAARRLDSRPD